MAPSISDASQCTQQAMNDEAGHARKPTADLENQVFPSPRKTANYSPLGSTLNPLHNNKVQDLQTLVGQQNLNFAERPHPALDDVTIHEPGQSLDELIRMKKELQANQKKFFNHLKKGTGIVMVKQFHEELPK